MWPLSALRPLPLSASLAKASLKFASSSSASHTANNSSSAKVRVKHEQNVLFDAEAKRQAALVTRVEKILVTLKDIKPGPENGEVVLLMNKGISTPHHCARHISDLYATRSVAADIGSRLVDMHSPLEDACTLRFAHFREPDCALLNQVYWRSCSFLLGACISYAFRAEQELHLHSYPKPTVNMGSFVYDVKIPALENWTPSERELEALNVAMRRLKAKGDRFERLKVSKELASKIFEDNPYKLKQVQGYNDEHITLYRLGDHIDMSIGPMIPDTSFVGSIDIVAVHQILSRNDGQLYRFQGTSIPAQLAMNHFAYKLLLKSAEKLNPLPPQ